MWEELYSAHYPELLRYAAAACRNETAAEDLAQEVFLRALQSGDAFLDLGPSQRRAWLFHALKNCVCDRFRRAALEAKYAETFEEDAAAPEPGYGRTENELLLAALPEQDRVLFRMRYMEGYNASELSEIFHLPTGTIRARLSRTRGLLKGMLGQDGTNWEIGT